MADKKREFQKTVRGIRVEMGGGDYPKALMTAKQMEKNTATVNCGLPQGVAENARQVAQQVIDHPAFQEFLTRHHGTAGIEPAKDSLAGRPTYQVRVHFKG